jgi:hypothetical protein
VLHRVLYPQVHNKRILKKKKKKDILFWVVCRIGEELGEDPPLHLITTGDNDSMCVSIHKGVIKQ